MDAERRKIYDQVGEEGMNGPEGGRSPSQDDGEGFSGFSSGIYVCLYMFVFFCMYTYVLIYMWWRGY
jgi:DnaJ-class molecular chaperone